MNFKEEAQVFSVAGEQLLGIIANPDAPHDCGVLMIVGGPQYRAGSHRQFVLMSRHLAAEGFPTMRLDYRGMGDSTGAMRSFEDVSEDIAAAIDAFQLVCPEVRRFVLWGLCDAASASLLYRHETVDSRVAGLVLLNPWVRSETSLAQTHIKHYYLQRLLQREFWLKLMRGELSLFKSACDFMSKLRQVLVTKHSAGGELLSFQEKMALSLRRFSGHVLFIFSGQDFTAKEFREFVAINATWSGAMNTENVSQVTIPEADHTFSSQQFRQLVETETLGFLNRHFES